MDDRRVKMNRNIKTSLYLRLFIFSIFMIPFVSPNLGESNETILLIKGDTVLQKSAQLKRQANFEKCFGFKSLKHGIYAKISVNENLVKGSYIIDYGYSGNNCKEYPFNGILKKDGIDIQFKQKNPYEMSLGWELEGGEKNLKAILRIIDDRLVHSRAFSSYATQMKKGIESIDFMKEINCNEISCP
jgi:hypothetical protein